MQILCPVSTKWKRQEKECKILVCYWFLSCTNKIRHSFERIKIQKDLKRRLFDSDNESGNYHLVETHCIFVIFAGNTNQKLTSETETFISDLLFNFSFSTDKCAGYTDRNVLQHSELRTFKYCKRAMHQKNNQIHQTGCDDA